MKIEKLQNKLKELERVAIAYSGGIDSSFLLFVANKVLPKENVLAIIVNGQMVPREDYKEAIEFLKHNNFNYKELQIDALKTAEFKENHKDRCYHCKKNMMIEIKEVAKENGFEIILDGKNLDDASDYRPGNEATKDSDGINIGEKTVWFIQAPSFNIIKDREQKENPLDENFKKHSFILQYNSGRYPNQVVILRMPINNKTTVTDVEAYFDELTSKLKQQQVEINIPTTMDRE